MDNSPTPAEQEVIDEITKLLKLLIEVAKREA